MKAVVKKTIEISMSEEEAIRLGSEIEYIISETNAMLESKVNMSIANSIRIMSESVGTGGSIRAVFDLLKFMANPGH